ncbi:MAG: ribosomal RNA small subunit methyltransferase A [Spartobacteria bacterium]|nr:ribosomal RNA small subunit methyltransferase A [Spartobacteria bacterium]
MDTPSLTRPSEVQALLQALELKPSRVLGQNFLIDRNILWQIIMGAGLRETDHVLEIGPGLGVLTEAFLELGVRVTAVEKDPVLCRHLRDRFYGVKAFTLIEGDALEVDVVGLVAAGANKLISNLPYSVGNRILVDVVGGTVIPELMLVMVQRDVANRMTAKPGTKSYGLLTILLQNDYSVHIEKHVSPTCFLPPPQIWSSIVRFTRRPEPLIGLQDAQVFRTLLKWAFSQRRKQMSTLLKNAPYRFEEGADIPTILIALGINPKDRPEDLSIPAWGQVANRVVRHCTG